MISERLTLIGRRFSHHAVHSGYDQLAVHLNLPLTTFPREYPSVCTMSLPYINEWYTLGAAAQEAHAANEFRTIADKHIVHFIYAEQSYRIAADLCGNTSIRWVASFHQPPSVLSRVGIDRNTVQALSAVILMGRTQEEFFEQLGARHIHVIHHGIDCYNYRPANRQRNRFTILTVGHWLRDFDTYFAVAEAALDAHLPLQFRLIAKSGLSRKRIPLNCTVAADISDRQLLSEYLTSACFYLPLLDSTANNALLEALACGLPAVVSDVGCMKEYVGDTHAAILCCQDTEQQLSALLSISCMGSDYFERSAAAREIASRYDWRKIAREYASVYAAIS